MPPGLGEILADTGDLTLRRLRRASDWRRVHGGTIERALLATGAVCEDVLLDALEKLTGIPGVSRARLAAADRAVVDVLPAEARHRLRALPFDRHGDVLQVAVVDPGNPVLETGLVASTGCGIRLYVTAEPILEDLLRAWDPPPQEPVAGEPGRPSVAPAPPPHLAPRAAGDDPFARLARALLVDALDEEARAVEIGPEGRGALVRTYAGGVLLSARPLPLAVLEPLVGWLLSRSRPAGPFDEGGLLLERAGRRFRVALTVGTGNSAWLVLEPEPSPVAPLGETEICLHPAEDGDVFCPACGAPL